MTFEVWDRYPNGYEDRLICSCTESINGWVSNCRFEDSLSLKDGDGVIRGTLQLDCRMNYDYQKKDGESDRTCRPPTGERIGLKTPSSAGDEEGSELEDSDMESPLSHDDRPKRKKVPPRSHTITPMHLLTVHLLHIYCTSTII